MASAILKSNEVDVALSSIEFLKQLVSRFFKILNNVNMQPIHNTSFVLLCLSLTSFLFDAISNDQVKEIAPVVDKIKHSIQASVLVTAIVPHPHVLEFRYWRLLNLWRISSS